jgi:circadian clock protein KaiB
VKPKSSTEAFELATSPAARKVVLRLFVAGSTDRSVRAIRNAKAICEEFLSNQYELDIIDILQQPDVAREEQILAVPTLVKKSPLPLRRFIGDLSNRDVVLVGLDVKPGK